MPFSYSNSLKNRARERDEKTESKFNLIRKIFCPFFGCLFCFLTVSFRNAY